MTPPLNTLCTVHYTGGWCFAVHDGEAWYRYPAPGGRPWRLCVTVVSWEVVG